MSMLNSSGGRGEPQLDFGDLDMFLEGSFADLTAFAWPEAQPGVSLPSISQGLEGGEPAPVRITLGQEDLYGPSWQTLAHNSSYKAGNASGLQPLPFDNTFGASFDFPEADGIAAEQLQHSPATPQRPSMGLDSRQASENGQAQSRSPLSPGTNEDSGDIRVTFKDKMNPPADSSKALSLAERNKQAQRRHRQRQKDRMGMLEAQVKQLTDEKQDLAADKATLAGQNAVLKQVLQMRDEQLQQLRENPPANFGPMPSSNAATSIKEESAESNRREEGAISSGLADSLANVLTLTVRQDQEIKLSPSQVKAMAPQEVSRMWAEYLSAMMKELQVVDRGPSAHASMAESRIKLLLQEVLVLLMRYALGDLHKMKTFVVSYLDSSRGNSRLCGERREMWRAAAHNMDLTEHQRKALIQLRQLYMSKQNKLVSERLAAIAAMHVAIPDPASSHDIALQFLRTEQAIKQVESVLNKENQLIVDLVYTVLLKVVTPIQAAKCLVSSYPSYPDSLCILTWVAAEAGQADAMKLLDYQHSHEGTLSSSHSFSAGDHSA